MSLSSVRSWFAKGNRAQWCVFGLFALTIFVKCNLFHWFYFHSIILSSIWKAPWNSFIFYAPKIIVSILLASFVFVSKRFWWTIALSLLIDLWAISNLVYFQANGFLLDVNAILMATNLYGFESSIGTYFRWAYLIFVLLTLVYCFLLWSIWKSVKRNYWYFIFWFALVILSNVCLCIPDWKGYLKGKKDADFDMANGRYIIKELYGWNGLHVFIPFHEVKMNALPELTYYPDYAEYYVYQNSFIHYSIATIVFYANSANDIEIHITDEDVRNTMDIEQYGKFSIPQTNLIMVLVESFESWPLELGNLSGEVAPHFMDFLHHSQVFYANHIRSEAKHGVSGDGQMTINTGLLPIQAGAACMLYGDNIYPNIASNFHYSMLVDICDGVWNQRKMTQRYGYKKEYFEIGGLQEWNMFHHLAEVADTLLEPFCTMGITSSMHTPFDRYNQHHLDLQSDMPHWLHEYLECVYLTDSCFGLFWNEFKQSPRMENTTIVVTGDHTVFKPAMLRDFQEFAHKYNYPIPSDESYCPLIIYSPQIEGNIQVTDTCYQMDIYPTIMHLIGCEDYYWKGFGVNLLDSVSRHNRPISEQEAYRLSDMMIRSDYFRHYK